MGQIIIVMGVSGSGKTTVGAALAQRLNIPFYDGDSFQPPENIAKMERGLPLDDEDRYPWLFRLRDLIADKLTKDESAVVACSALKRSYRDILRSGGHPVFFIYLQGKYDLIWRRMASREGHYMKPNMLQSQFDALEPPSEEEAIIINVENSLESVLEAVIAAYYTEGLDDSPSSLRSGQ